MPKCASGGKRKETEKDPLENLHTQNQKEKAELERKKSKNLRWTYSSARNHFLFCWIIHFSLKSESGLLKWVVRTQETEVFNYNSPLMKQHSLQTRCRGIRCKTGGVGTVAITEDIWGALIATRMSPLPPRCAFFGLCHYKELENLLNGVSCLSIEEISTARGPYWKKEVYLPPPPPSFFFLNVFFNV